MNLDLFASFKEIDASGMLGYVGELPDQLANAWTHAAGLPIDRGLADVKRIAICGMGGSAIGGDLFASLTSGSLDKMVAVNRGYELPAWVRGKESLVIAMSHSGNTEETLTTARQALDRGARLLAITTGGKLAEMAEGVGAPVQLYRYPSLPRAALGWLYGMLLSAADRLGWLKLESAIEEAVRVMDEQRKSCDVEVPLAQNPAKQIASKLAGKVPVIWGSGVLEPVARRWKTQINENAKSPAFFDSLPELDHNTVVGVEAPAEGLSKLAILQLAGPSDHPRVAIRQTATAAIVSAYGLPVERVAAAGVNTLANQFSLILLGDYVSYYLAMLYDIDPSPIPQIDELKVELARHE